MVFTITKTGNDCSEVLYNSAEHETVLDTVKVDQNDIYTHYKRENGDYAYILNPVMDTLCLTLHLAARKQQNALAKTLKNWDNDIIDVKVSSLKNWGNTKIEKTSKHAAYNRKYKITVDGIDLLLQIKPTTKSHKFMRLTMQPSLFVSNGLDKLWETLKLISGGVIDADYVCEHASLTQIDWAIDYLNVPMDDLILLKPGSYRMKKLFISSDGKIETDYIQHGDDAEDHKHSKAYVYDKVKHPSKDKKYTGSYIPVSRVEFRTYPEYTKFSQFMKEKFGLANRFDKYEVIDLMAKKSNVEFNTPSALANEFIWKLFSDHMRIRGRENALSTIPDDISIKYKEILERQLKQTWHPSKLWKLTPEAVKTFLCKTG